jgi:hypothetical protein
MSEYQEPVEKLTEEAININRAINSLREELEAVNWYNQRVVATKDPELKKVMAHNRDEEIEHACMVLEWLRRNMPHWDEMLKTYLFTDKPITEVEAGASGDSGKSSGLGIGSLKK